MLWDHLLIQQEKHKYAIVNWSLLWLDLIRFQEQEIWIHFHYPFHKWIFWDGFLKDKAVDFIFRGQIYNSVVDKTFLLRWRKVDMTRESTYCPERTTNRKQKKIKVAKFYEQRKTELCNIFKADFCSESWEINNIMWLTLPLSKRSLLLGTNKKTEQKKLFINWNSMEE